MLNFEYAYSGRVYSFARTGEDRVNLTAFASVESNPRPKALVGLQLANWLKTLVKVNPSLAGQYDTIKKTQLVSLEIARQYVRAAVGPEEGATGFKVNIDEETRDWATHLFHSLIKQPLREVRDWVSVQLGELRDLVAKGFGKMSKDINELKENQALIVDHYDRLTSSVGDIDLSTERQLNDLRQMVRELRDEVEKLRQSRG